MSRDTNPRSQSHKMSLTPADQGRPGVPQNSLVHWYVGALVSTIAGHYQCMIHKVMCRYLGVEVDTSLERIIKQRAVHIPEQPRREGRSPVARRCRAVLWTPSSSAGGACALDLGHAGGLASDLFKDFQRVRVPVPDEPGLWTWGPPEAWLQTFSKIFNW